MAQVNNCNIAEELFYWVEKHVWVRPEGDGVCTIGMSDVAQSMAGKVVAVTAKKVGRSLKKGKSVATIESSKWVGPVPCPINGEISEVNSAVAKNPGLLNEEPYGDGWIVKMKADDLDAQLAGLVTGDAGVEAYRGFLESEGIECK